MKQFLRIDPRSSSIVKARSSLRRSTVLLLTTLGLFTAAGHAATFNATEDAYLQAGTRFNNTYLKMQASAPTVSYIKFSVTGVTGTSVTSTRLLLTCKDDPGTPFLRVYNGTSNTWSEATITSSTAPAKGTLRGSYDAAIAVDEEIIIELSNYITADGTYTLVVEAANGTGLAFFASKDHAEAAARPKLIINTTGGTVAAASFSPAAGTYSAAQNVAITTSTSGASIRYTTDGSTPSATTGTVYSGPVSISSTTTLKAIAYKTGMTNSSVTSGTYTINVPAGGTFIATEDAYLQAGTRFNNEYLKMQASTPIVSYLKFSVTGVTGATVTSTNLVLTCKDDPGAPNLRVYNGTTNTWSETTITSSTAPAKGSLRGSYDNAIAIDEVVTIPLSNYITTDGTYSLVIEATNGTGLAFFASKDHTTAAARPKLVIGTSGGGASTVAGPVFSPAQGTYSTAQSVTITTSTSGATIRYTTNGTTPTSTTGTIYSSPVLISSTTTLKAIAYKSGMINSSVTTGVYTIGTSTDVVLNVGSNFQSVVNANPAGTRYLIKAGTHRLQSVVPKNGDVFIGETGAIMSGAKVLSPGSFTAGSGHWWIGGQTQQGTQEGCTDNNGLPGVTNARDCYPEDLWVNGSTRLQHVASLGALGPGKWFLDYAADRIYMYDNPSSFSLIEASVTTSAFHSGGVPATHSVARVQIHNLIVEKYANPMSYGAIGGGRSNNTEETEDWIVKFCTVRYNHGSGMRIQSGGTVENCLVHDNGASGLRPHGENKNSGYRAFITIRNNNVHHNRRLTYKPTFDASGMKATHIYAGMLFENNWIHDNYGFGAWWDVYDESITIRSNLLENNWRGAFIELCNGPILMYWNTVRNNGVGTGAFAPDTPTHANGIFISNSRNVDVYENEIYGNYTGVYLVERQWRSPHTVNVSIYNNDIKQTQNTAAKFQVDGHTPAETTAYYNSKGNDFYVNTYRLDSQTVNRFYWNSTNLNVAGWKAAGQDNTAGAQFLGSSGSTSLPAGATGFTTKLYGQQ